MKLYICLLGIISLGLVFMVPPGMPPGLYLAHMPEEGQSSIKEISNSGTPFTGPDQKDTTQSPGFRPPSAAVHGGDKTGCHWNARRAIDSTEAAIAYANLKVRRV